MPESVVVKLEASFDEPDGVGGGAGDEAGSRCGTDVHDGGVGRQNRVEKVLGLRVGAKVNGAGRSDADEVGPQAFEQGGGSLVLHNMAQALHQAHRLGLQSVA